VDRPQHRMMDMFKILHRLCGAVFWAAWLLVAVFIYQRRAALAPVGDLVELLWNQDRRASPDRPRLIGRVNAVYAGDGVQLRDDRGSLFNYGLAGVAAPHADEHSSPADRQRAAHSRTNLARLVLHQRVEIEVTRGNPETRTGLGLLWLGPTNVNVSVLAAGDGTLRRDQIRALPLKVQWTMVGAERSARESRPGIVATNPVETAP